MHSLSSSSLTLSRLSPRELALLSLTCRAMNVVVSQFLTHCTNSFGLRHNLRVFYETNSDLLLPKEVVLKERLEVNSRHELLLYSSMRQFVGEVQRYKLKNMRQNK